MHSPDDIHKLGLLLNNAIEYRDLGQLQDAYQTLQAILQNAPQHVGALQVIADVCHRQKNHAEAVRHYKNLLTLITDNPSLHNGLGKVYLAQKNNDKAIECFQAAVKLKKDFSPGWFNLGRVYKQSDELDKAANAFRKAIKHRPNFPAAIVNLGNVLQMQDKINEAGECYQAALDLQPNLPEGHYNLGVVLQKQAKHKRAIESYKQTLQLNPDYAQAYTALASIYSECDDLTAAEQCYQAALQRIPQHTDICTDYGMLLRRMGRMDEALACFRAVLKQDENNVSALINLGAALQTTGFSEDALKCNRKVVELEPENLTGWSNLGMVLEAMDDLDSAATAYERAFELSNKTHAEIYYYLAHTRMKLCDWRDYDQTVAQLLELTKKHLEKDNAGMLPPWTLNAFDVSAEIHHDVAKHRASNIQKNMAGISKSCDFNDRKTNNSQPRLKIGYTSPDFRQHAVGLLIKDMFAYHDRDQFEVFAYSLVDVDDHVSQRIRRDCEHFVDVSKLSTQQAAQQIYDDGIQILIDMAGYTTYSRPEIMALQPAPIQISYLGYIDTMGANFVQHFMADAITLPDKLGQTYSENIIQLPGCFMPAAEIAISDKNFTRNECGLPESAMVFCSFNHPYKIDPGVFAAWMEILQKVPGSVLWLYGGGNKQVESNLKQQAEQHNIEPGRLVFAEHMPPAEHQSRMRLADLFLDTFIYNGGATTIGALSVGVPVLTLPGNTALARMGASIVTAAGLPELVCESKHDYISRAVDLSQSPEQIVDYRAHLLTTYSNREGLWNNASLVKNIEYACQLAWQAQ